MVAVDAQILGGVAVTVLLALLFFGVVVLWDVALALRGVADKIDKLEDTVDDDLTDLEQAIHGAPGGGGPQVHLSGGGTITPGSAPRGQQGPRVTDQHGAAAGRAPQATNSEASDPRSHQFGGSGEYGDQSAAENEPAAAGSADSAQTAAAPETDEAGTEDEPQRSRAAIGVDPTPVRRSSASTDSAATADETATSARAGPVSQGRFVTSPDRMPWYRTALDWNAIHDGRSPIAGELEAGDGPTSSAHTVADASDSPDEGAASEDDGPEEGSSDSDSAEDDSASVDEPIVVDPDGSATTESPAAETASDPVDPTLGSVESETGATESGPASASDGASDTNITAGNGSPAQPRADGSPAAVDPTEDAADDEEPAPASESDGEPSSGDEPASTMDSDARESIVTDSASDAMAATSSDESDGSIIRDSSDGDDESAAVESTSQDAVVDAAESDAADGEADGESDEHGTDEEESSTDLASDGPDETLPGDMGVEADESADAAGAFDQTDGMEFTFEEFSPEDSPEPTLTVDEAVESVNENAPSLSRSTHGIEASAEVDDDGVVLVYDLESGEATDSTTRLLKYQLESFANQSDAAVDVTVTGTRIVVDIPAADGSDVSQWEAAIVEVIDRTLYLSDNSE